jgi:isopentenyl diphosphate isomerase/L-lactate dehydrogenase-like FMN-dependent dehydrogenase
VSWEQFAFLRDRWPGKLIIKGILRPDDASRAIAAGVDAIVVSNHGGRCLDSAVASIDALPSIVAEVKRRVPVIVDSGIRRGSDIVKALALGADLVMVGRATLWGMAAGGRRGAERALALLRREFEQTLAFVGAPVAAQIGPDVLAPGSLHRSGDPCP